MKPTKEFLEFQIMIHKSKMKKAKFKEPYLKRIKYYQNELNKLSGQGTL